MTTSTESDLVKHLWKSAIVGGILAVILGIAILAWPGISLLVAGVFFGAYLLVSGIAQIVFAFTLPATSTGSRVLLFLSGAASLILGVLCFRSELESILLLAIWIGVGWIIHGVASIITAVGDAELPGRGWQIFGGVITAIAGVVIINWPADTIVSLALVVAIWLIVVGVMQIGGGIGIRSATKDVV